MALSLEIVANVCNSIDAIFSPRNSLCRHKYKWNSLTPFSWRSVLREACCLSWFWKMARKRLDNHRRRRVQETVNERDQNKHQRRAPAISMIRAASTPPCPAANWSGTPLPSSSSATAAINSSRSTPSSSSINFSNAEPSVALPSSTPRAKIDSRRPIPVPTLTRSANDTARINRVLAPLLTSEIGQKGESGGRLTCWNFSTTFYKKTETVLLNKRHGQRILTFEEESHKGWERQVVFAHESFRQQSVRKHLGSIRKRPIVSSQTSNISLLMVPMVTKWIRDCVLYAYWKYRLKLISKWKLPCRTVKSYVESPT